MPPWSTFSVTDFNDPDSSLKSRASCVTSGKVWVFKVSIAGFALFKVVSNAARLPFAERSVLRNSSSIGRPSLSSSLLVEPAILVISSAARPAFCKAMRDSWIAARKSGPWAANVPEMLSTLSKICSTDCSFLSDNMLVSRSVRVDSRSKSKGALLSSSPKAPGFVGMTGTPVGQAVFGFALGQFSAGAPLTAPSSWTSETPVKPMPLIVAAVP